MFDESSLEEGLHQMWTPSLEDVEHQKHLEFKLLYLFKNHACPIVVTKNVW